jgi:hypothetical protein
MITAIEHPGIQRDDRGLGQGLGRVLDCLVHGLVMPSKGQNLGGVAGVVALVAARLRWPSVAAALGIGVAGGPADGNPGG